MYSLDFRKKVFEVKEKEELTFEEVSKRFHVVITILFLWQDVEKNPDAY